MSSTGIQRVYFCCILAAFAHYADIDLLKRNSQRLAVANIATTMWVKVVSLNRCENCNNSKP